MSIVVIESGPGWVNVRATSTALPLGIFVIVPALAIINAGQLHLFAQSFAELAFFQKSNVKFLAAPIVEADTIGYNSGNDLLGMPELIKCSPLHLHFCSVNALHY